VEQRTGSSPKRNSPTPSNDADTSRMPSNRLLEPTALCFCLGKQAVIDDRFPDQKEELGEMKPASYWKDKEHGKCPDYLFVAYTAEQFPNTKHDLRTLHSIAAKATRRAGLHAYWIGCSCMGSGQAMKEAIYRISDVVRGAHSLAVIIGPGANTEEQTQDPVTNELREFGLRVWTFPEILLSTSNQPINVYRRGEPIYKPLVLSKIQFAALAWRDVKSARQLVDHYEGNLTLSRLELVIIALKSLFRRETKNEFLPVSLTNLMSNPPPFSLQSLFPVCSGKKFIARGSRPELEDGLARTKGKYAISISISCVVVTIL